MSEKSAVQGLVRETLSTMGRLDVVVSNVGWTRMTNFTNLDEGTIDEDWDKCFVYNVKTHLWLMHAVRSALDESEGCFISTASVAGVKPSGSSLPYAVTKAAQIHLAKSLAVICSPRIRVNSVSPGMMLTEWGMNFPESKRAAAINNTKLKRLATVEVRLCHSCRAVVVSDDGGEMLTTAGCCEPSANTGTEHVCNRPEYSHRRWIISIDDRVLDKSTRLSFDHLPGVLR